MMLAHGTAPLPFIVSLEAVEDASDIASRKTNSTVPEVHYKPMVNWGDKMEQHEIFHSSNSQFAKADRNKEVIMVNLSDNYSEYRQGFMQILEQFSTFPKCGMENLEEYVWRNILLR